MKPMNAQQRRFVDAYLSEPNGARAARKAGYAPARAHAQAHTLLRRPDVSAMLAQAQAERAARLQIDRDEVVALLRDVAFTDYDEVVDWGMRGDEGFYEPRDAAKLSPRARRAVAEVIPTAHGPRVRLYDRMAALAMLAKHLGIGVPEPEEPASTGPTLAERMARMPRERRDRLRELMLEAEALEADADADLLPTLLIGAPE